MRYGTAIALCAFFGLASALASGARIPSSQTESLPTLYPPIMFPPPSAGLRRSGTFDTVTPAPRLSGGKNAMYCGDVIGETLVLRAVYDDAGSKTQPSSTPAPALLTISPVDKMGCIGQRGDTAALTFSPNSATSLNEVFATFDRYNLNGTSYAVNAGPLANTQVKQYNLGRAAGQKYSATTCCSNDHNYTFILSEYTQAESIARMARPARVRSKFVGAFARPNSGGNPPTAMFLYGAKQIVPRPYPLPKGTNQFGRTGYCDEVASNGVSIATGYPLDFYKISDLVVTGVAWTRSGDDPVSNDFSHVIDPATGRPNGFVWVIPDALECGLIRNGIVPEMEIANEAVNYGTTISPVRNNLYKSPADYAAYCSAVARHQAAAFPQVTTFTIPGNEQNITNGYTPAQTALTINPTGYLGYAGVAAYSLPCFQAIKAVNPKFVVYWGEVSVNEHQAPVEFITSMYKYGLRIGKGFDAISLHASFCNDPLAAYDSQDSGFQKDDCLNVAILHNITAALHNVGETRPVRFEFGEFGNYPNQASRQQTTASHGDAAYTWARFWYFAVLNPQIVRVAVADLDEPCAYLGTVFANNSLFAQASCAPAPSQPTPLPELVATQIAAGVDPLAPPTVAPDTAPLPPLTLAQIPQCGRGDTLSFSRTPNIYNTVVGVRVGSRTIGITDSLKTPLRGRVSGSTNSSVDVSAGDYMVAGFVNGAPGNQYHVASGSRTTNCLYELTYPVEPHPIAASKISLRSEKTLTATISSGIRAGALLICAATDSRAQITSVSISNAGAFKMRAGSASLRIGDAFASHAGAATCTMKMSASGDRSAMLLLAYNP